MYVCSVVGRLVICMYDLSRVLMISLIFLLSRVGDHVL